MSQLISVTTNAVDQIKKILLEAPIGTDALVVGVDKSGCSGYSYKLDFAYKDNVKNFEFVSRKGKKLYIDPKASLFLIGTVMDYKTDKLSSRFVFNNPKQKNTCGCGESFQV